MSDERKLDNASFVFFGCTAGIDQAAATEIARHTRMCSSSGVMPRQAL
jgi:hypothetical protein